LPCSLLQAARCLALTDQLADLMQDFDRAYAYEAVARANVLAGNREQALAYLQRAREHGEAIGDGQSKAIFLGDLEGGNWHGLR